MYIAVTGSKNNKDVYKLIETNQIEKILFL